jgi:sulfite exporter TauE/SafE
VALSLLRSLALRDLSGATRLDRMLWMNIGLDAGYALVGITLVVVGWRVVRRLGLIGAGVAIILQGVALALIDLLLASQISR